MNTVFDYIKYYKQAPFTTVSWNDMDNIVLSIISYLPIKNSNKKLLTLQGMLENIEEKEATHTIKNAKKVIAEIQLSPRYKNIVCSNYQNIINDKTQFCAMTFRLNKTTSYIAFRGTDDSIIGWKENFELAYQYPVTAQQLAINYLQETVKITDKILYIGGHSKGGNLAMTSAMETTKNIFKKIKYIYNNDGPGFLPPQYESANFTKILPKLKLILPEESVIGMLLSNTDNAIIVKSRESGLLQHDLTTWCCFGSFLIPGIQSLFSIKIKQTINQWLKSTETSSKENLVNILFQLVQNTGAKEIKDLKISKLITQLDTIKKLDNASKKLLAQTIKSLWKEK